MSYALIITGYMAFVAWMTFTGDRVHNEDANLPAYRQRILVGRAYWRRSWAPRWHIWAAYAAFPLILMSIIFFG